MQASAFKYKCIKWFKPKRIAITSLWKLTAKTVDIDDTWHFEYHHSLQGQEVHPPAWFGIILILEKLSGNRHIYYYYYYWCCFKNALQIPIWNKNAFYKIPSICKMYFFIYMTSKVYEFYEFNWNECLSIFFPFWLLSTKFSPKLDIFPSLGKNGYWPINLYRCSDGNFGALTLCQTVFRPVCVPWHYWTSYGARFDQFRTIKTFSK